MSFKTNFWEAITSEFHEMIIDLAIPRDVVAKDYLFHEKDPYNGFYIIKHGRFRLFNLNPDGQEVTISVLNRNNVIALVPVFTEEKTFHAYCTALDDSRVLFIEKLSFLSLMISNSKLMLDISKLVIQLSLGFREKYLSVTLKNAEQRVMEFFLALNQEHSPFKIPISKKYLASLLDITPESLSRVISKLKTDQLILEEENGTYRIIK